MVLATGDNDTKPEVREIRNAEGDTFEQLDFVIHPFNESAGQPEGEKS